MVTWNEEHNHVSNEEGFNKRKAKTDLINAIVTSGKIIVMQNMLIMMIFDDPCSLHPSFDGGFFLRKVGPRILWSDCN